MMLTSFIRSGGFIATGKSIARYRLRPSLSIGIPPAAAAPSAQTVLGGLRDPPRRAADQSFKDPEAIPTPKFQPMSTGEQEYPGYQYTAFKSSLKQAPKISIIPSICV
jgi:hypothetical protein